MELPFDLETASREQLLALIAKLLESLAFLQAANAELQARVAELEAKLQAAEGRTPSGTPSTMPGHKPTVVAPKPERPPRRRRAHGFSRPRMAPTATVAHALDRCPHCGDALAGGWVKRRREVIEVAVAPATVTEHVYVERQCARCGRRSTPKPELGGVVVGQQRLGIGVLSTIAALRAAGRLPNATLQWYLETFHGLHLSEGAIVAAQQRVAAAGEAEAAAILTAIRAAPMVQGDETGWRENGANRYTWSFCTPTERSFTFGGRNKEMVDQVLGETFSGTLVCDFYAAYDHYEGLKQRCWAHLLRDVHALVERHPADRKLRRWAVRVQTLYRLATGYAALPTEADRLRAKRRCERALLAVCRPFLKNAEAPQRVLSERIEKYLSELFVFVADPRVPSTNNGAERSIRPLVTVRNISGGTRSSAGTETTMRLATLTGTWRARSLNPFHEFRRLLAGSPQL
jgi:hypothetical protein